MKTKQWQYNGRSRNCAKFKHLVRPTQNIRQREFSTLVYLSYHTTQGIWDNINTDNTAKI